MRRPVRVAERTQTKPTSSDKTLGASACDAPASPHDGRPSGADQWEIMPILPGRTPITSRDDSRLKVEDDHRFDALNAWRVRSITAAAARNIRSVRRRDRGIPNSIAPAKWSRMRRRSDLVLNRPSFYMKALGRCAHLRGNINHGGDVDSDSRHPRFRRKIRANNNNCHALPPTRKPFAQFSPSEAAKLSPAL